MGICVVAQGKEDEIQILHTVVFFREIPTAVKLSSLRTHGAQGRCRAKEQVKTYQLNAVRTEWNANAQDVRKAQVNGAQSRQRCDRN